MVSHVLQQDTLFGSGKCGTWWSTSTATRGVEVDLKKAIYNNMINIVLSVLFSDDIVDVGATSAQSLQAGA